MAVFISADSRVALERDADVLIAEIAALVRQIHGYEEQIAALQHQRAMLQDTVEKIQSLMLIAPLNNSASPERIAEIPEEEASGPATPVAATLADEIEAVIRAAKMPLHYKEILNRLRAVGVNVGGKEPAATVLSILANKRYEARFARSERGIYTLAVFAENRAPSTRPSKRRRRPARARRPLDRSA